MTDPSGHLEDPRADWAITGEIARLRRALEASGTVTQFLESGAGEPIVARKLRHDQVRVPAANPLGLPAGEAVADRAVLLEGRTSGRSFAYAESSIACRRLPGAVCRRLASGDDPIGRVLVEESLIVTGVPRGRTAGPRGPVGSGLAGELAASPLVRSYLLEVARIPVVAIDEWFLPAVLEIVLPG
ncbi:MAG: chorismate--pyruvate lyase family protein [Acidimicrobiales bacterium]